MLFSCFSRRAKLLESLRIGLHESQTFFLHPLRSELLTSIIFESLDPPIQTRHLSSFSRERQHVFIHENTED